MESLISKRISEIPEIREIANTKELIERIKAKLEHLAPLKRVHVVMSKCFVILVIYTLRELNGDSRILKLARKIAKRKLKCLGYLRRLGISI